mgnify:CR=1 FL=1|jgi:hypothetical protein|tara:strand:+ start:1801 stop:2022 length:222 start_codon:yes stop_codon:yes gene_type:complete
MEKISNSRCFLLSDSISVQSIGLESEYCFKRNMSIEKGSEIPVVLNVNHMMTASKTMCAPGDDDPDPESEACY